MLWSLLLCTSFMFLVHNGMTSSCEKVTSCKCNMTDGSGEVDLTSLQGKNGQPRFKDVSSSEIPPLQYSWNPCTSFREGGGYGCSNVAVCQVWPFTRVSGGSQDSATFSVGYDGKVSITYTENYTTSVVDLICDENTKDPIFTAKGDPEYTNNIKLYLKHACSCPGMCDDGGIVGPSGGSGGGLSTGTILIIVLPIVLLIVYLVGGMVVFYYIKRKQEAGRASII